MRDKHRKAKFDIKDGQGTGILPPNWFDAPPTLVRRHVGNFSNIAVSTRKWKWPSTRLCMMVPVITSLCFSLSTGCKHKEQSSTVQASVKQAGLGTAEPKSAEAKSVEPKVQSEIEKAEAQKRAALYGDAKSALDETNKALAALDGGDKKAALEALAQATGKLDLVVSRDPKLALAPVGVSAIIFDLYATPEAVNTAVTRAKEDLSRDRVQQARDLLKYLASEVDLQETEIPLASYPAAIKAISPLIDAGKIEQAKAGLTAALNTLVVETYVMPLPPIRAEAMLATADDLVSKNGRKEDKDAEVRGLVNAARNEIKLSEALGYGIKDDYKPLYTQLDALQKKIEGGQSGHGLFDKIRQSVKHFNFSR
jgi:hypothetical protein